MNRRIAFLTSLFVLFGLGLGVDAVKIPDHLLKVDPEILNLSVHKSVEKESPDRDIPDSVAKSFGEQSLYLDSLHKKNPVTGENAQRQEITSYTKGAVRYLDTIIKLDSPDADIEPIIAAGGEVQSQYGEFLYADLPETGIDTVARLPQVLAISGCHPPLSFERHGHAGHWRRRGLDQRGSPGRRNRCWRCRFRNRLET